KDVGEIKKLESFVSGFDALQCGATVPNYSELSITGVLLNGLHVNYKAGNFNIVGIAGRINDNSSFFHIDREQTAYSKLYVAGMEEKLSDRTSYGIYILNSDFSDEDSLSYYNFLERDNTIAGRFTTAFLKNKIQAEGEIALSYAQNREAGFFA